MSTAETILGKLNEYFEETEDLDDMESYDRWRDQRESIAETVIENIDTPLEDTQVKREVYSMLTDLPIMDEKTEWKQKIEKFLEEIQKESKYIAYLLLPGIIDLPTGLEIGPLEVSEKPDKERFMEHLEHQEEKRKIRTDNGSWARVKFGTYRVAVDIREELYEELELPYSILYLALGGTPRLNDSAGAIYSPTGRIFFLTPERDTGMDKVC